MASQADITSLHAVSYVAHSSFALVFPLHLLYLVLFTPIPALVYLSGLSAAIKIHLSGRTFDSPATMHDTTFPTIKFLLLVSWLTLGVTLPGLIWFAAISLAS